MVVVELSVVFVELLVEVGEVLCLVFHVIPESERIILILTQSSTI